MVVDLTIGSYNQTEQWPIEVPDCDDHKDPFCEGNKTLSFQRTFHTGGQGTVSFGLSAHFPV